MVAELVCSILALLFMALPGGACAYGMEQQLSQFEMDGGATVRNFENAFDMPNWVPLHDCRRGRCRPIDEPNGIKLDYLMKEPYALKDDMVNYGVKQANASWWIGPAIEGIWNPELLKDTGIGARYVMMAVFVVLRALLVRLSSSTSLSMWTWVLSMATSLWSTMQTALWSPMFWTLAASIMIIIYYQVVKTKNVKKSRNHLGPGQVRRRWQGNLRARWENSVQFKCLVFLGLYVQANGMTADQANELVGR